MLNVTKQNLNNKMQRDNFSTIELVEIADALDLQLLLKDKNTKEDGKPKEYIIDYPEDQKGKPKREKIKIGGVYIVSNGKRVL